MEAVTVAQVHAGPVRKPRHERAGQRRQRFLVVDRRGQHLCRRGEQPIVIFQSPLLGDVQHGAGGKQRRTVVVEDDPPAVAQPSYLAVRADDAKLEAVLRSPGDGGVDCVANTCPVVGMNTGEGRVMEPARRLTRLQS